MKEQIKLHQEREASGLALIPLLFFIVIYLGVGIVLHAKGVEMAFYQFPSVVAMTIAVILAFLMYHKTGIDNNFKLFARGAGDENIMTMLMIFLLVLFLLLLVRWEEYRQQQILDSRLFHLGSLSQEFS